MWCDIFLITPGHVLLFLMTDTIVKPRLHLWTFQSVMRLQLNNRPAFHSCYCQPTGYYRSQQLLVHCTLPTITTYPSVNGLKQIKCYLFYSLSIFVSAYIVISLTLLKPHGQVKDNSYHVAKLLKVVGQKLVDLTVKLIPRIVYSRVLQPGS